MWFWRSDFPESFFGTSILPYKFINAKNLCYRCDVNYQVSIVNQYKMSIESHHKRSEFMLFAVFSVLEFHPSSWCQLLINLSVLQTTRRRVVSIKWKASTEKKSFRKRLHPWKIVLLKLKQLVLRMYCFPGQLFHGDLLAQKWVDTTIWIDWQSIRVSQHRLGSIGFCCR